MTARTDIHRPSAMNPQAYTVLAFACVFPEYDEQTGRDSMVCEMESCHSDWEALGRPMVGNWVDSCPNGSRCDHCGAKIKYPCIVRHDATGDLIAVGRDCVRRFFNANWSQMEQTAAARRKHETNWKNFTAAHPAAVDALKWAGEGEGRKKRFARELYEKAILNGYALSVNQVAVLVRMFTESQAPIAYTAGRREINGTVVSAKVEKDMFASRGNYCAYKWTVTIETAEGFKVHGTLPESISPYVSRYEPVDESMLKGARIRLTATIEPKDAGFALYSRPAKATFFADDGTECDGEAIVKAAQEKRDAAEAAAREAARVQAEAEDAAKQEFPANDATPEQWQKWVLDNCNADHARLMEGIARCSVLHNAENPVPAEDAPLSSWKAWRRFWTLKRRENGEAFGLLSEFAGSLFIEWEERNWDRLYPMQDTEAVEEMLPSPAAPPVRPSSGTGEKMYERAARVRPNCPARTPTEGEGPCLYGQCEVYRDAFCVNCGQPRPTAEEMREKEPA